MSLNNLVAIIQNAQCHLRTSTNWNSDHSQFNCLLNFTNDKSTGRDGSEAWCASINDTNQYLICGSEIPRTFMAVALQGRGDLNQWVTSYKIRYSLDNVTWFEYRNGAAITGVNDQNTVNTHFFDTPIRARSIAIHPLTWNTHVSLRCEFYAKPVLSTYTQVGTVNSGNNTPMNQGTGDREVVVPVVFPEEFSKVPHVTCTFEYIDCTADPNGQVRTKVYSKDVTTKGFNCVFGVWSGSKVYRCIADYTATVQE